MTDTERIMTKIKRLRPVEQIFVRNLINYMVEPERVPAYIVAQIMERAQADELVRACISKE